MFDTGRASRILCYESYSLKYLLHKFCEFEADKTYQLADWRIRPLNDGMIKYARCDTHFLLYIYDELKKNLIIKSFENGDGEQGIFLYYKLCIKNSCEICLQSFQKPQVKDKTYYQYSQLNRNKSKIELGIIKETYIFRDYLGRLLDRDPKEILKKSMIFKLSKATEFTIDNLLTIINFDTPFLRYLNEYIEVINAKIQKVQKKSENSFQEIKKKNEIEYIQKVQKILEKSKEEEKMENSKNKIFLNEQKIKEADDQIIKYKNNIKISKINTLNTLFLTKTEKERDKIKNNSINTIDIPNNNILNNFNLVNFLNKKHGISQIEIKTSKNENIHKELGSKKERNLRGMENQETFSDKTKDMKDLTNNERIIRGLKENYEMTKKEVVSESESSSDSESYEKEKESDIKKRETKVQKKIRQKEERLKNFIKNNKESKYENQTTYKYKGKKRK
jgi:exosome complex exonuclease RRP6